MLEGDDDVRVTVLEARTVCSGATGRNGGHIKAVPEFSYTELLPNLGREMTDEVLDFTLATVEEILQVASTLSTDLQQYSEVRRVESLNICTSNEAFSEVDGLAKAYNEAHAIRGRLVDEVELREVTEPTPRVHHRASDRFALIEVRSAQCSWGVCGYRCRWLALSPHHRHVF